MDDVKFLKQQIISEQEKLNNLLREGQNDNLVLEEAIRLSTSLDKLIVEYHKLLK